jgi:hypothetical protein
VCIFNEVQPLAFFEVTSLVDLISPGQTTCKCSAVPIILKTLRE